MKTNIIYKLIFISCLLIVGQVNSVHAQTDIIISESMSDELMNKSRIKGPLEFKGYAEELTKKLKGAIVTLSESPDGSHENLTEIFRTVTPGNGSFEFKLEINKFYVLSVEKSGYTTKKVDFDTDVTMAREQYTTVPKFEFRVDMVKDLDGLEFVGSVAKVFYQIKQNRFDYELDYSKEEMEDEERERREQEERARLAKLAYEKKKALEEAAEVMRDRDNATAQQLIKAAITIGDEDKAKIIEGFKEVFPEVDTLRERKATVMYDKLLDERKRTQATGGEIDFMAIFNSAKNLEDEVEAKEEEERQAQIAILREEKEEAERKAAEAMALEQRALELEAKEKLAKAIAEEELAKAKEEKEKQDKIYYALFDAPNSEFAIQNLIKTYPKSDEYKEEKARAIYDEYEKARLGGTTLTNMDFSKLFEAADAAEQEAIKKEIEEHNAKQNSKLDAFMARVEEQKREEQKKTLEKIEKGLTTASKDRASQIAVFKDALPKNDPYKEEKAEAMYEEYVAQKKIVSKIEEGLKTAGNSKEKQLAVFYNALPEDTPNRQQKAKEMYNQYTTSKQAQGGTGTVALDFASLFGAAEVAETEAREESKQQRAIEKRNEQEALEARRQAAQAQKTQIVQKIETDTETVRKAELSKAKDKKERKLGEAFEKGNGDRDATVKAIMKALPETDDKELDRERAEAVYDAYLEESAAIERSGSIGKKIDYSVLFAAADQAELDRLERQFQQKQAEQEIALAKYQEQRTQKAIEIAEKQQVEAEKEVALAEKKYEETLLKTEAERQERLAEERRKKEELEKAIAMEKAKREAHEKEIAEQELAAIEKERADRLAKEKAEQDRLLAQKAEEERKAKEAAEREAAEQLALLEKQRKAAEEKERKRIEAEEKERERLALLAQKEEESRKKAEEKRLEEERKARIAEELAAAKAAEEARKAKEAEELAAAKAAELARKEEQKRLEEERKAKEAAELAAAKAAEEARIAEENRLAELAKAEAEEAERQRKASYDEFISKGDRAMSANNPKLAQSNYKEALALYPEDKVGAKKLAEADVELKRIEEEQAAQLALEQNFNKLIQEANDELAVNNYDAAKAKFQKASELKPNDQSAKRQIKNIDNTLERLAADEKAKQEEERAYILNLQDAAKALEANNLQLAKEKYQEANRLRPDDQVPIAKLREIGEREAEIAKQKEVEKERQELAQKKFEEEQAAKIVAAEAEAARKEKERQERIAALGLVDAAKEQKDLTKEEQDAARIEAYEKLKESLEEMGLNAEEQRQAFLSELARIYPEGLTKETVTGKNFVLLRHVINENNVVTILEKKTWDWGGVFYFKNTDIAITEAIYRLEIGKYQ